MRAAFFVWRQEWQRILAESHFSQRRREVGHGMWREVNLLEW
jgi:hypothetical protein